MFVSDFNQFPELFYCSVATCHGHDSSCCKSEFIIFQLNFDLDSKRRVSEWLTPPFCLLEPSSQKTWTRRSPSPAGPTTPTAIIIAITTIKNINFLIIIHNINVKATALISINITVNSNIYILLQTAMQFFNVQGIDDGQLEPLQVDVHKHARRGGEDGGEPGGEDGGRQQARGAQSGWSLVLGDTLAHPPTYSSQVSHF